MATVEENQQRVERAAGAGQVCRMTPEEVTRAQEDVELSILQILPDDREASICKLIQILVRMSLYGEGPVLALKGLQAGIEAQYKARGRANMTLTFAESDSEDVTIHRFRGQSERGKA